MSSTAIIFRTPLAQRVTAFLEQNVEVDETDDVAALGMRNAVLDCLGLLAIKATTEVKTLTEGGSWTIGIVDMLLAGILNEVNLFMLFIGQVPPRGRNWWKMQIAILSNLELRLEQVALLTKDEADKDEEVPAVVEESGEKAN